MASSSRKENIEFDGRGDVKVFLTKVELVAAIKGHTDEKKAQFVASKLMIYTDIVMDVRLFDVINSFDIIALIYEYILFFKNGLK